MTLVGLDGRPLVSAQRTFNELLNDRPPAVRLALLRARCEFRHRDLLERYTLNRLVRETLWDDFEARRARQHAANKAYLAAQRRR
jgi:hypothetical protein